MVMMIPKAPGYAQMLKEGTQHLSGVEEAVLRSIEACNQLYQSLKSCYGPMGLNKLVVNHLGKLFITNDAATIIHQLDVQHPAAKLMVMASQNVEKEVFEFFHLIFIGFSIKCMFYFYFLFFTFNKVGDGTNFVILLVGCLLEKAEELIRQGLKPIEIVEGYELACKKVLEEILPKTVCGELNDFHNLDKVVKAIKTSIASKQYGQEDFLANLIAESCIAVMPKSKQNTSFNIDNVRVCKILGSGLLNSTVVHGMVFKKMVEGTVTKVDNAKVVVYTCPIDVATTETKGTVLIKSANELMNFSRGEETEFESKIQSLVATGVQVIVSGGKFSDLALHYCNKYGLMAIRVPSKFDVRRVCRTVGATAQPNFITPKTEELGFCDYIYIDEIGDTSIIVFKQESKESKLATIVVRGSTDSMMDDIERAIDDGVNTYKALTKDGRMVPGAGATEAELSVTLRTYAESLPGMEQYGAEKFAEALQQLPVIIADNAGITQDVITDILVAHQEGNKYAGVNIESEKDYLKNAVENNILDTYLSKYWGIKYATDAVNTILRVDQIICAKPAGGPKPRQGGGGWDQD